MGVKELIQRMGEKSRAKKEMFKQMEEQQRMQEMLENRSKSANERELEGYLDEDREAMIKEKLEFMRKKRRDEINFDHNALDVENITNHTEWEVMKERNMFKNNGNIFANQEFIHKTDRKRLTNNGNVLKHNGNLLKSNMRLVG